MQQISKKRWGIFAWGVFASALLHLTVAAFFLLKLPEQSPKPPEEETLQVDLVPPPEEKKPEETKPPEAKPEEKKPEEKKPVEKPPEPQKEEKPPAPPPPPPAPPPPPEQTKPPEEKPKPEAKAEQPKAEEQSKQASDQQGKPQPLLPLRPVFEFGDNDTGPQKSETGDASVAGAKPDVTPPASEPEPKPAETAAAEKKPVSEEPPANPVPEDIELPQVETADIHPEKNGPAAEATAEPKTELEQAKPPEGIKPDAKEIAKPEKPNDLTEAKTLFSQKTTNDSVAKTAMGNLPRGLRVGQLCSTELGEQLKHSSSGYRPEVLPSYRLPRGTVLDVKRGAFGAVGGRWYNISFRCEVDADATKVVSFAFDVGDAVPRSEWKSRGFPED